MMGPFTVSQWQELENQALIFKYMAAGAAIPAELILPLRRSFFLEPPPPSQIFPHHPSMLGWGCFQMGLGRKTEDPEPGRCRRTDGKKWRCSKEAFPESKYCERHMHRGKNRSRKPADTVAVAKTSPPPLQAFKDESIRGGPWRFTPLGTSSLGGEDVAKEEKRKHCFVLGADLKEERFPMAAVSHSRGSLPFSL
ncbi:growth-regulating factor 1-like [Wolffia australiana]